MDYRPLHDGAICFGYCHEGELMPETRKSDVRLFQCGLCGTQWITACLDLGIIECPCCHKWRDIKIRNIPMIVYIEDSKEDADR